MLVGDQDPIIWHDKLLFIFCAKNATNLVNLTSSVDHKNYHMLSQSVILWDNHLSSLMLAEIT